MAIIKSTELAGAGQYPSKRLNQRERKCLEVAESYSAASDADWESLPGVSEVPSTQDAAIDALAEQAAQVGTLKSVKVEFDASSDSLTVGTHGMGVTIPDNAVILYVMQEVLTDLDSVSDTGTFRLNLPTDGNLAAAITADGSNAGRIDGTPDWTAANSVKTTAAREVSYTVATNALTAGKMQALIVYIVTA
jgi:hypothetical protein